MQHFSAEFDISVLAGPQQQWMFERATNHHFDTIFLIKVDKTGAWLDILYDDGVLLKFFVTPEGKPELLDVSH